MIVTALLLTISQAQTTAAPVAAPDGAVAQEVVVLGRKLKTWRATIRTGSNGLACRTKTSSGDPEVDALGCAAMTQCWPTVRAKFDASMAKGLAKADRQRLQDEANTTMTNCVATQHKERIEALAVRRTS